MHGPALPVVIPLLIAAILAATGGLLPRRVLDTVAILTAAAVCGICLWLMQRSAGGTIVYWFGGWKPEPHGHFPVGICFMIDPIGAGLAALVALLVLAAMIFSAEFFQSIKSLYHCLMLVFMAAMCGLCLTGDLFNLFVWFEVMTATGVTLCGYESEEHGPLQGALNFAVSNTLGAYLTLTGVALIYGHVGALNMAQVSQSLIAQPPGGYLVPVAFLFIASGFLVKAAAFPFHFWLADAHAVAPTPVCVLFSGVMVELGLYAVARLYWNVFAPSLNVHGLVPEHVNWTQALFLTMGTLTAVVGALQCFTQRHLKRLLAFSTISHVGLMLIGFALLAPDALAGTALYVVGHGMVKGALFICVGILLHRFASVDEFELQGRGRQTPWTGVLVLLGAVGLSGLPPFANYSGESMIDKAAEPLGLSWISGVFVFAGALTSGAVLRIGARCFLGWGVRDGDTISAGSRKAELKPETEGARQRVPWTMWAPACVLLLGAMTIAASGSLRAGVRHHAHRMQQTTDYNALVLNGTPLPETASEQIEPYLDLVWKQLVAFGAAIGLALLALFPTVLGSARKSLGHALDLILAPLKAIHTGRIGDYVAWFLFGIAGYGIFLLASR
jgi:multicomponent Na+:H+ antiporter subunit D